MTAVKDDFVSNNKYNSGNKVVQLCAADSYWKKFMKEMIIQTKFNAYKTISKWIMLIE